MPTIQVGIGYTGNMIIKDLTGKTHIFLPYEAAIIGHAYYKYVQKKHQGVLVRGDTE